MPNISISTLPVLALDYTHRGPGLLPGLKRLEAMLESDRGRQGSLLVNVTVAGAVVPIVLARADLYVVGFKAGASWFRFDDAAWPFSEPVTPLGYSGQYASLGGLTGNLTMGAVDGISRLGSIAQRTLWKEPLRNLLVVVSECARLIPVQMQVLGLLNDGLPTIPLGPLAHYIQNWDKASKGKDMSREVAPGHRVGFSDPTIIKR